MSVTLKQKAVDVIKSLAEPEGWPGDIPNPFPLGRAFVSPKEWLEYATEEVISLEDLKSVQSTVDRKQVLELALSGAPDINPLPIVTVFPDDEMLIIDGNHRLTAKFFLGHKTAKVRLINIDTLPEEVIFDSMDKGKISMKLFNQLIESVLNFELNNILFEQTDEQHYKGPLYHVTYYNRLEGISGAGLRPGMGRSIGASSYDAHAKKGVFVTEEDGVDFWHSRAENFAEHNSDNPLEDGLVPVVLRIDSLAFDDEEIVDDELGSQDAKTGAYIFPFEVEPGYIEVWDGSDWIPVEDWQEIDIEQAFDREEVEDEDGGPEEYFLFKYDSPLKPNL